MRLKVSILDPGYQLEILFLLASLLRVLPHFAAFTAGVPSAGTPTAGTPTAGTPTAASASAASFFSLPPNLYRVKSRKGRRGSKDSLPVRHPAVPLRQLRRAVDHVAPEQEVVLGRDGEGVAREDGRVDGQGGRHAARDAVGVR
jgi:hypothetical protein